MGAEEDMATTFKEDVEEMGVSWHGARRIGSDREKSIETSRRLIPRLSKYVSSNGNPPAR